MTQNGKKLYLLAAFAIYFISEFATWALNKVFDISITVENLSKISLLSLESLSYLSGPFGLGCITSAAIFTLSEAPKFKSWLKKAKNRKRNKAEDELLAKECTEVSSILLAEAFRTEGAQTEAFLSERIIAIGEEKNTWLKARIKEGREQEKFKSIHGERVQHLLIRLISHGLNIDTWGLSISQTDLQGTSWLFSEIAASLRSGDYAEKTFKSGRMPRF
jgi:hypothetical protein